MGRKCIKKKEFPVDCCTPYLKEEERKMTTENGNWIVVMRLKLVAEYYKSQREQLKQTTTQNKFEAILNI